MMLKWVLLVTLCHVLAYGNATLDVRLPKSISPIHYRIKMIPVLEKDDFRLFGSVRMDFNVNTATDVIVMHALDLNVINDSVKIFPLKGSSSSSKNNDPDIEDDENTTERKSRSENIKINGVSYDKEREFVKIQLGSKLKANRSYQLSLSYRGVLSQDLKGFYRAHYFDKKSQRKVWFATTQMEPTSARKAFPCLDEPAMKATFEIILGRQGNMTSLSNMPLVKTEPMRHKDGWFWDYFEKSVPMSTYLVACLVSDFAWQQGQPLIRKLDDSNEKTTTDIRIWSRPDVIDQSSLAGDVTVKMLEFLETYFQVPYPLPKLDLVAVPDFSAGAMENWGLITFRETALLKDPKSPAVREQMYVERVIAHELAHQWFGNLVTMVWWNDLWLNEGFASYVYYRVVDEVSPKFESTALNILETQGVMDIDSLDSSHPISVEVTHPNQIGEIFDSISYKKGAAVIRMMNHFLGESSFRQGLANYLSKHKYGNAQQDDLWSSLTKQWHLDSPKSRHLDVKSIMDTWTLQMGYPLITITRNYTHGTATVEQRRYLRSTATLTSGNEIKADKPTATSSSYRWWVPVSITDSQSLQFGENNTQPHIWLSPENITMEHKLAAAEENSWILANIQVTGYYRVNYDNRNWQLLRQQLTNDHRVIHVMNRAQLINDIFALASTKILSYPMAFDFIQYLPKEDHYVPWSAALRSLGYVSRMLSLTPNLGRYRSFVSSLVKPAYIHIEESSPTNDEPLKKFIRITLTEQACGLGYKPCVRQAQDLFDKWMNDPDPVHYTEIEPDLRSSVYCTAIKHGGQMEWDFAWQMMLNATSAHQRDTILSALGCSREPWILIRYLSYALDLESGVKKQDSRRVISAVASNPVGRPLAFTFVQDRWNDMLKYYGSPLKALEAFSSTTSSFNTAEDLIKIKLFFASKSSDLETTQATYKKMLTNLAANIEWMEENYQPLVQWLEKNGF